MLGEHGPGKIGREVGSGLVEEQDPGVVMSALPIARSFRSPPLSVPAVLWRKGFRVGRRAKTWSMRSGTFRRGSV